MHLLLLSCLTSLATASLLQKRANASDAWYLERFTNLLTFGDSYTDENRLAYFITHQGNGPPPGTVLPESFKTASGGRNWERYVVQYTGSTATDGTWDPQLSLYNYAVSGAVCSNNITPRIFPLIHANFPSVLEYELPAFLADLNATRPNTTTPTFSPALGPSNSVYVIWIGTNDLGVYAFITDSQVPGTSIVTYLDCVYNVLDGLYATGARYFVVMNAAPLDLAPLYANLTDGGLTNPAEVEYWTTSDRPSNLTALAEQMREYTLLVNDGYSYRTPFEALISGRYSDSNFAVFNVHDVVSAISSCIRHSLQLFCVLGI